MGRKWRALAKITIMDTQRNSLKRRQDLDCPFDDLPCDQPLVKLYAPMRINLHKQLWEWIAEMQSAYRSVTTTFLFFSVASSAVDNKRRQSFGVPQAF